MQSSARDQLLSGVGGAGDAAAEPWDCGGLYQVGSFPNWDVWGEWNGRFRDDVRCAEYERGSGLRSRVAGWVCCINWDVWGEWNGRFRDDVRCVASDASTDSANRKHEELYWVAACPRKRWCGDTWSAPSRSWQCPIGSCIWAGIQLLLMDG